MLAIIIFSLFILLVIAIIVFEVRNEKRYQEKRRQRRESSKPKQSVPLLKIKPKKLIEKVVTQEKPKKEEKKKKKLPTCTYPKFTHSRLIDMGLSNDEAKEFVQELIPQLEEQIPLIEEAMRQSDFHQMERLTHSIKGSTTNLGIGGVSDLLVEGNTYLKTGTDSDIANVYFESLKYYTKELKEQYT